MKNLNNPLTALKHKNYRYYWLGMCVSLTGTWMQNMAQPWLALILTKSPLLVSLVGALQFLPVLLFSAFMGVIVDRLPKKKLLVLTQSVSAAISLILAILVFTQMIQYWHLLILSLLLGVVNALDMPARQSFIIELVDKKNLMNAIALNSTAFNAARIVGPALAGIIIFYFGMAVCFFANSISYVAVLISLIFIKPNIVCQISAVKKKILAEAKDGFIYIYKHKVLFNTLFFVAIIGTFAANFSVLVPVMTMEVLHQGEAGYGFLMSFLGVGSLIGAIFIASISRNGPSNFIMKIIPAIIGVLLIGIGFMSLYILVGFFLAVTGFFFVAFSSNANSTMQIYTDNEYRGRVMSIYSLVFAGSTPIGNLYAGFFAERFGANTGFMACGGIILLLLIPLYIYNIKNSDKIS